MKSHKYIGRKELMPSWWGGQYRRRLCSKRVRNQYKRELHKITDTNNITDEVSTWKT